MAQFKPFKAIRPNAEAAPEVAALPYDVMTSAEAREMAGDNPLSFLHVDKAEIDLDESVPPYDDAVYLKARENLDKMIENGTFIADSADCYYIYALTMNDRTQTGVVGVASVDEYLNGTIKKHELTREDKERDRIRHVEACGATTGPVFLAYKEQADVAAIVAKWKAAKPPAYDFTAEDGVRHTVWTVDEPGAVGALKETFLQVPALYIADGHHRNASAVKVALRRRNSGFYKPDDPFNFYLAVAFPAGDLSILDYNRVVADLNGMCREDFLEKVSEAFDVIQVIAPAPLSPHQFGMYLGGVWYRLTAKPDFVPADLIGALDVSILQNALLAPILGIDDPRTNKRIDFVGGIRGYAELEKRVNSGEMAVAFTLAPTSMGELMAVADAGLLMPPKSTWFEPKLRSGLFIHKIE